MANYQIRNVKPDVYQVEMFLTVNNTWMVLGNFPSLDLAVADIKRRVDAETFKERLYDPVGRLIITSDQPVQDA